MQQPVSQKASSNPACEVHQSNEVEQVQAEDPQDVQFEQSNDAVQLEKEDELAIVADPGNRIEFKTITSDLKRREILRRAYIQRGPTQPSDIEFPFTLIGKQDRRFSLDRYQGSETCWSTL